MAIDTVTPRSRRAILLGALGGAVASVAALAKAPTVRAADPNDVVLDADNAGAGTTAILTASSNPAFRATTTTGAAVRGEATTGSAVEGVATSGVGVTAVSDSGTGIAATAATGHGLRATSTASHGLRGRGQLDGVIGESPGGRSGVVGYSGAGSAPAGPGKTGVYGEATQDTASRGVSGFSLEGQGVRGEATTGLGVVGVATTGQGVRGEATTGYGVTGRATTGHGVFGHAYGSAARGVLGRSDTGNGVRAEATTGVGLQAVATTGVALAVSGRATFSRSGRVSVPINRSYVDVTVPGGLVSAANVLALLQVNRTGVWVTAARINYPTAGKVRIYLNKVASTTTTTSLAWFVLG
jgi:hypothetical protein